MRLNKAFKKTHFLWEKVLVNLLNDKLSYIIKRIGHSL